MWSFLTAIPGLLSGLFGTVNHVTDAIANEKIAGMNATTEQERTLSNERVATLQMRRDVMLAESNDKTNRYIRACLALGPMTILLKIFVWDKVVGSFYGCAGAAGNAPRCATFNTDPLDPNLWQVVMVVLGFYFLSEATISATRIIKSKLGK